MTEEKNEVIFDDDKISKSEEFVNPDELYQELIQCVQKYHPSDDISMIEKAYKVASEAHKNQFRKSGEPYIIHPLNVAIILADLKLDKETIVAGILHDVVEDTVMTEEDLKREFGDDVALLVDGVTKLEKIPPSLTPTGASSFIVLSIISANSVNSSTFSEIFKKSLSYSAKIS